jgi:hypothetical protein
LVALTTEAVVLSSASSSIGIRGCVALREPRPNALKSLVAEVDVERSGEW